MKSLDHLAVENKAFRKQRANGGRGGVFGNQAVAAAMINRIVDHADLFTLKDASHRLRGRDIDSLRQHQHKIRQTKQTTDRWPRSPPSLWPTLQP